MSKLKYIFIYLIVIFFFGCKSQKETTYTEKVKDSTVRNIILESKSLLEVSTICDSIGNAKEFYQEIENDYSTTTVSLKDNNLKVETNNDSIVYVDREVLKEVKDIQVQTVYKTPKWAWWYIIIVTILALIGWKVWRLF